MPVAERQPAALMHEEGIEDNIYRPPVTPVWEDAWGVTEGIITMMARETAARHAHSCFVVTLANPPQIYPAPSVRGCFLQTYERDRHLLSRSADQKALGRSARVSKY